jgi:predicted transcriptional regulator
MKRTTISLPDDLAAALEREARRRRVSVSHVAREALAERLGSGRRAPREIPFAGIGRSGYHDTARNFEEAFDAEWDRDRGR